MIVGPRLIPRHIGVILVVVIGAAVRVIGEGPPHQAVANAVAAAERVLWLHIPKTGGTTLALVAMKAALKKEGKIAVCACMCSQSKTPTHASRQALSSSPSSCTPCLDVYSLRIMLHVLVVSCDAMCVCDGANHALG